MRKSFFFIFIIFQTLVLFNGFSNKNNPALAFSFDEKYLEACPAINAFPFLRKIFKKDQIKMGDSLEVLNPVINRLDLQKQDGQNIKYIIKPKGLIAFDVNSVHLTFENNKLSRCKIIYQVDPIGTIKLDDYKRLIQDLLGPDKGYIKGPSGEKIDAWEIGPDVVAAYYEDSILWYMIEIYRKGYDNIESLSRQEFEELISIIIEMYKFPGLSELVKGNPVKTKAFVNQMLERNGMIKPGTIGYNFIATMALHYQNHHHSRELLEILNTKVGGVAEFLDNSRQRGISILKDVKTVSDYFGEVLTRIRKLLIKKEYLKASDEFKKQLKYAGVLLSGKYMTGGDYSWPDIAYFAALCELRLNNLETAKKILYYCIHEGYPYALFLIDSNIYNKANEIDDVFSNFYINNNFSFSFDEFIIQLTGSSNRNLAMKYWLATSGVEKDKKISNEKKIAILNIRNEIIKHKNEYFSFKLAESILADLLNR